MVVDPVASTVQSSPTGVPWNLGARHVMSPSAGPKDVAGAAGRVVAVRVGAQLPHV